jgi:hypothetical protein
LHSTFLSLSFGIKYHGLHMFRLPSIDKTLYTRTIGLINIIKIFNNKIGNDWNLALIANVTFENSISKIQTSIKVSPLPLKVYGNGWC